MTWFARRGDWAYGGLRSGSNLAVARWHLPTGDVEDLCEIPDATNHCVTLSAAGNLVAVSIYGYFYRYAADTGTLQLERRLDSDAYGALDCLRRIDRDRLLGTPFITQRFWESNLTTRKAYDCGRAAPGGGEVLQTWKLGKTIYMAAYAGGELLAYDPARHPHFPENPRVVAAPAHSMRPIAAADDGVSLFYACSKHYGHLGSTLTRYHSRSGAVRTVEDPLPALKITSLRYVRARDKLICGSSVDADCQSCPPTAESAALAVIDAKRLRVEHVATAPAGVTAVDFVGLLSAGTWLCRAVTSAGVRFFAATDTELTVPEVAAMDIEVPACQSLLYANRVGLYVLHVEDRVELWDLRRGERVEVLYKDFHVYRVLLEGASVYLCKRREVIILEDCLRGRRR
jgi:hypothetical protein